MTDDTLVQFERKGSVLEIVLNRSKALNSLTLDMVRLLHQALDLAESDRAISCVLLRGAGERGLCAGGDIRAIYESGRTGTALAETFWREEYQLNARIDAFPKPYVALMDGIVMGGGIGLASFGSHRIVTERSRVAMPETSIGYFPDVGTSWLLSRPGSEIGTFLGLTGNTVGAGDAITAGLADYEIPSQHLSSLCEILFAAPSLNSEDIDRAIRDHLVESQTASPIAVVREKIDRLFAHDAVEVILEALDGDNSDFARTAAETLRTRSPNSLKVTLRLLRLGRQKRSLMECLDMEFVGTRQILKEPDFFEGIRAAVVDKDRNPKWSPATLDQVREDHVDLYFQPPVKSIFDKA